MTRGPRARALLTRVVCVLALGPSSCLHDWASVTPDAAHDGSVDVANADDVACTACGAGCVDLSSDPSNCGACDHACAAPDNATAGCIAGQCAFACVAGFDRCGDHCYATDRDVSFCGRACVDCSALPHVNGDTVNCTAGVCTFMNGCEPNWADCDHDPASGCETDLSTVSNCGACGRMCSGAVPACVPMMGEFACVL